MIILASKNLLFVITSITKTETVIRKVPDEPWNNFLIRAFNRCKQAQPDIHIRLLIISQMLYVAEPRIKTQVSG